MKNALGFSIIEVLVALGIMSVVTMGMATLVSNQTMDIKSLDEKMSLQGVQTQISNVLTSPAFCGCFIGTNTFNYTTSTWNGFPTAISYSYDGTCAAIGGALLTVGSNIGTSNLKPTAMAMQNIAETTAGSGNFSANLVLQFDSTLLTRSRKPLSIPINFKVNMADPVGARALTSCGSSAAPSAGIDILPLISVWGATMCYTGPNNFSQATATCPAGYKAIGGGGLTAGCMGSIAKAELTDTSYTVWGLPNTVCTGSVCTAVLASVRCMRYP